MSRAVNHHGPQYNRLIYKWLRWLNPMEYLKLLYGVVGVRYPLASLIVVSLTGALVFGSAWWLLGKHYQQVENVPHISPTIQDRPHIAAAIVIDAVKETYVEHHVQITNIGSVPINNLRTASRTKSYTGGEFRPLRLRLLPPRARVSILGLARVLETIDEIQDYRLTVTYNASDNADRDFFSSFLFRIPPSQLTPGTVIDPISADEPETVPNNQQRLTEIVGGLSIPAGTYETVIPEQRDDNKPNFVNIYEPEGEKLLQFDPVKRIVSFSMTTTSGRRISLRLAMQPTRSRTHVIHFIWDNSKGAALAVDGKYISDGLPDPK